MSNIMSKKGMRLGILLDIILDSSLYPKNVQIICPIDIQDMSKILVSNIGYTFWSPVVYSRIGPIWVQNVYIFGHFWTLLDMFWSPFGGHRLS